MQHLPQVKRRCPSCDYHTDAVAYYGEKAESNYDVCIDDRVIDGFRNPMCGQVTDAGFGCIRWESLWDKR